MYFCSSGRLPWEANTPSPTNAVHAMPRTAVLFYYHLPFVNFHCISLDSSALVNLVAPSRADTAFGRSASIHVSNSTSVGL